MGSGAQGKQNAPTSEEHAGAQLAVLGLLPALLVLLCLCPQAAALGSPGMQPLCLRNKEMFRSRKAVFVCRHSWGRC